MQDYTDRLTCRCGAHAIPLVRWRYFDNGTWHIEAKCPSCRRWITWLPQTPENVTAAYAETPPDDPTPTQDDLLRQHQVDRYCKERRQLA